MRRVTFKLWIPADYEKQYDKLGSIIGHKAKEGTNCWSDYVEIGFFHQWGSAYEESSEGFGNYTVALVEMNDGTIVEVLPANIKFLDQQ